MRSLALLSFLLCAAAGCPADPDGQGPPDATAPADDASPGSGGLVFRWKLDKGLPVEAGSSVTIDSIELRLRDVRALGDAAPGDARTTRDALELTWKPPEAPEPLAFRSAPPGLYSELQGRLAGDGGGFAFRIRGTAPWRDGELHAFEVEDEGATAFSVALSNVELKAGAEKGLDIELRTDFLGDVDWSALDLDQGVIELETGDPQMPSVRAALVEALRQK